VIIGRIHFFVSWGEAHWHLAAVVKVKVDRWRGRKLYGCTALGSDQAKSSIKLILSSIGTIL
jgi:hypothetical protein